MNDDIVIRPAAHSDLDAVLAITGDAHAATGKHVPEWPVFDRGRTAQLWTGDFDDRDITTLVTVRAGVVVAVFSACLEAVSPHPSRSDAWAAHVLCVASHADDDWWSMFGAGLAELRQDGFSSVRAWVPARDLPARQRYLAWNLTPTGRDINFAGVRHVEVHRPW